MESGNPKEIDYAIARNNSSSGYLSDNSVPSAKDLDDALAWDFVSTRIFFCLILFLSFLLIDVFRVLSDI